MMPYLICFAAFNERLHVFTFAIMCAREINDCLGLDPCFLAGHDTAVEKKKTISSYFKK